MKCSPLQAMFYLDWVDVCIGVLVLLSLLWIFRDLRELAKESNSDETFQIVRKLCVSLTLVASLLIYHRLVRKRIECSRDIEKAKQTTNNK